MAECILNHSDLKDLLSFYLSKSTMADGTCIGIGIGFNFSRVRLFRSSFESVVVSQ
jgi:hypothetical protein